VDRATKRRRKKEERQRRRANRKPSVLLQEFWNVPNMLTVGRILVIPLFVWLTYEANPLSSFWAAFLFTLAAVTDVIDGWLARKLNLITVMGKLLDPLADKLIVMAALVMMVRLGRVGAWVVIVLLAREFIVTGMRAMAASEGLVMAAGQEGKWKTALQLVALISLTIHYTHPLNLIWWHYRVNYNLVGKTLLYISVVMSVWSMVVYFRDFLKLLGSRSAGAQGA
jgi:CDP-diacylglycerol--glycerol-3-phosphate 3-phosphatidyltransferase